MGRQKLKIAYFHQDGDITGSAISLRHFINALDREQFEPIVVMAKDGDARSLYEELNVQVLFFPYVTFWTFPGPRCLSKHFFTQLRALIPNIKLRNFIKKLKPDVIHINDKAAMNVGVSVMGLGIPIVQHLRSSFYITNCKLNKKLAAYTIKKYSNQLIAISEDECDEFEDLPQKLNIIYNTVDRLKVNNAMKQRTIKRKELGYEETDIVIGMMANITAKKGAWTFLDMVKILQQSTPVNVKFIMVGAVSQHGQTLLNSGKIVPITPEAYIKQTIIEYNLKDRLKVTGFRKDNLEVMAALDLLIVPNSNGVLGRQPIEAQAIGVPVIAINGHSGKSSIIEHESTGYLLPIGSTAEQLSETVKNILANQQLRQQLRTRGIKHAELNFNPEVNIKRIEHIYLSLTQSHIE